MVSKSSAYSSRPGLRSAMAERFRASIKSTSLVGPGSAAIRFAKIQWIAILWRWLTLAEVAIMAAACPSCYFPVENALIVLTLGIAHTIVFSLLRARTAVTRTWPFYIADFVACMVLMILARDGTLIMVVSFYATTALFVRPMVRFSQSLALSALAGISFLLAMYVAPPTSYSLASVANFSLIFLFWGFAWTLTCRLIERAAMLEIDMHLEEQRRGFRRSLHDDLGNTLCGLHFKIQSLLRLERTELVKALAVIDAGYGRAGLVLDRIIRGIQGDDDCDSTEEMIQMVEKDFDIRVSVSGDTKAICLSHAVKQEVFSILREAISNSAKHSDASEVRVSLARCRRQLEITVSDSGTGFDAGSIGQERLDGGLGLRNMRERAEAIGARLEVSSRPDGGTSVNLSLKEKHGNSDPGGRLADRLIESDTYLLLVHLKLAVVMLEALQLLLGGAAVWSEPAAILVIFLVAAEAIIWYLFRSRLLSFLTRQPWWIVPDILFFCLLYFISWQAGSPVLVAEAASMAIILSAWFLGASRNLVLALIMGAGMLVASSLAPPVSSMSLARHEVLFIEVMDNLILAILAGLTCEFIRSIDTLRNDVIKIALERHRASLSAATHGSLYQLVESIRHDVSASKVREIQDLPEEHHAGFIIKLEASSSILKKRLRSILKSIDRPEAGMAQLESGDAGSENR